MSERDRDLTVLGSRMAVVIPTRAEPYTLKMAGEKPTLKELQTAVGGYIEVVNIPNHRSLVLIVDEEGMLRNKPQNLVATAIAGQAIVGNVVLMRRKGLS